VNRTWTNGASPRRDGLALIAGDDRRVVMPVLRERFARLLALAGVTLDGDRPYDVRVRDPRVFRRVACQGSVGLGEAYVDGWWDCDRIDDLSARLLGGEVDRILSSLAGMWSELAARLVNLPRLSRDLETGPRHQEVGNDLFGAMLDARRVLTCAYWKDARTLDEAQEAALDLICRKLQLKPGMRVLDLNCGLGGAARFAAERYQVEVAGLTVSAAQAHAAREHCAGLPVSIYTHGYRELEGYYDAAFSLGVLEHMNRRNLRRYLETVRDHLSEDGLFLIECVGTVRTEGANDFPCSLLPSATQLSRALEDVFVFEDWHNFGADYDRTLLQWHANFEEAWPALSARYGERFHRLWRYYLLSYAGAFRARRAQAWQVVLSPRGVAGGYRSVR
jgi:cyclopropane-fatty-acyl-phospholipid synthase